MIQKKIIEISSVLRTSLRNKLKGRKPVVSLITDFGSEGNTVGNLSYAVSFVSPQARVIDYEHGIPRHNILVAAWRLADAVSLPVVRKGDVFVVVVDPGVGSERERIVVRTKKGVSIVAPNNGVVSLAVDRKGLDYATTIENPDFTLLRYAKSATFDGLYVFSAVGAHVSRGVPLELLGREISKNEIRMLQLKSPDRIIGNSLEGHIVDIDSFGNLRTNIPSGLVRSCISPNSRARLLLKKKDGEEVNRIIALRNTFSDVDLRAFLVYPGSTGFLDIAVNQGNAGDELKMGFDCVKVEERELKPLNWLRIEILQV